MHRRGAKLSLGDRSVFLNVSYGSGFENLFLGDVAGRLRLDPVPRGLKPGSLEEVLTRPLRQAQGRF